MGFCVLTILRRRKISHSLNNALKVQTPCVGVTFPSGDVIKRVHMWTSPDSVQLRRPGGTLTPIDINLVEKLIFSERKKQLEQY